MLKTILEHRKSFTKITPSIIAEQVEQVNTDTGRFYKTPTGALYPSVTTVTGIMNQKAILEWRKRVGNIHLS